MNIDEDDEHGIARPGRAGRWLLASALFNVFLVGGIAGAGAWHFQSDLHDGAQMRAAAVAAAAPVAGRGSPPNVQGLAAAADGLSPAQRRDFRRGLHDLLRGCAALIRTRREGRLEAAHLLSEAHLDRAALDAALVRVRMADIEMKKRVEAYVVAYAASLPGADRATFSSGLPTFSGPFHVSAQARERIGQARLP